MDLVDAFLLASGIGYFMTLPLPRETTKNSSLLKEKVGMLISGTLLLLNLLVDFRPLWLFMGCLWMFYAGRSYLGYTRWNVQWRKDVSDAAQIAMFCWDMLIAVACLTKF